MKQLLTTIAALVLVGCGQGVDIHDAATWGDVEAVKEYLEAGGDVNAKQGDSVSGLSGFGWTPLHIVAQVNTFEYNISERYLAGRKILELLIANDADVNLRSGMIIKTEDGDAGEQMAQKSMNNRTPLDMAILFDHTEIADLLRKHGAKTGEELKAEGK